MKRGRIEKEQHASIIFGEHVLCRFCKGKGKPTPRAKDVCIHCDGRGYVRAGTQ
jgi:DnaJ-class molecular chaperone